MEGFDGDRSERRREATTREKEGTWSSLNHGGQIRRHLV